MLNTLDKVFPGKDLQTISGNIINFQGKNIVHSLNQDPAQNKETLKYLFLKNLPIVWVKKNLSEQLFLVKELGQRLPQFKYKVTILTPSPIEEKMIFSNLNFPLSLFRFLYFKEELLFQDVDKNKLELQESLNNLFSSIITSNHFRS